MFERCVLTAMHNLLLAITPPFPCPITDYNLQKNNRNPPIKGNQSLIYAYCLKWKDIGNILALIYLPNITIHVAYRSLHHVAVAVSAKKGIGNKGSSLQPPYYFAFQTELKV